MDVCNCRAGAIERVLKLCKFKMAEFQRKHGVAGKGPAGGQTRANNAVDAPGTAGAAAERGTWMGRRRGGGGGRGRERRVRRWGGGCGGSRGSRACSGYSQDARPDSGDGRARAASSSRRGRPRAPAEPTVIRGVDPGLVKQKDIIIAELRETNSILRTRSRGNGERLVRLRRRRRSRPC